jgi:hypothetical protein
MLYPSELRGHALLIIAAVREQSGENAGLTGRLPAVESTLTLIIDNAIFA